MGISKSPRQHTAGDRKLHKQTAIVFRDNSPSKPPMAARSSLTLRPPGLLPDPVNTAGPLTLQGGMGYSAGTPATTAGQLRSTSICQPSTLSTLLQALEGGPQQGQLTAYSGDTGTSLVRLSSNLASHHSQLCTALREPTQGPMLSSSSCLSEVAGWQQPLIDSRSILNSTSSPGDIVRSSITPGYVGYQHPWSTRRSAMSTQPLTAGRWPQGMLAWDTAAMQTVSDIIPAGARVSPFIASQPQVPDSDLQAQSRFVYPPVGSTFEGHRSKQADALGRRIDVLSDLQYNRPSRKLSIDAHGHLLEPGPAVRRMPRPAGDQLDAFLADWLHGGSKPTTLPVYKQESIQSRDLEYRLARFASGSS